MDMNDPIYDLLASHMRLAAECRKLAADIVAANAEAETPQPAPSDPIISACLNLVAGSASVAERSAIEHYLAGDRLSRDMSRVDALQVEFQAGTAEMQRVEFQIYSTTPTTPGGIWALLSFLKTQVQITGGSVSGALAAIDSLMVGLVVVSGQVHGAEPVSPLLH